MELALNEVKRVSKGLLKKIKHEPEHIKQQLKLAPVRSFDHETKLKDCQQYVAILCGFKSWQQCHRYLTEKPGSTEQMAPGKLWYSRACDVLLNNWFASLPEARAFQSEASNRFLLPFETQFVVVQSQYLNLIGISEDKLDLFDAIQNNLVGAEFSTEKDQLARCVIRHKTRHLLDI